MIRPIKSEMRLFPGRREGGPLPPTGVNPVVPPSPPDGHKSRRLDEATFCRSINLELETWNFKLRAPIQEMR